jgi:CPA1 family monovalent cation:H+ antiporter
MFENIVQAEELIIGLLLIASLVAIATRRFRLPYTVGLVLIGLLMPWLVKIFRLTDILGAFDPSQSSDIILYLLVPPLIFEAAFHIRMEDLRRDFWLILLLAVPGVIVTTLMVGGIDRCHGSSCGSSVIPSFGCATASTSPS